MAKKYSYDFKRMMERRSDTAFSPVEIRDQLIDMRQRGIAGAKDALGMLPHYASDKIIKMGKYLEDVEQALKALEENRFDENGVCVDNSAVKMDTSQEFITEITRVMEDETLLRDKIVRVPALMTGVDV